MIVAILAATEIKGVRPKDFEDPNPSTAPTLREASQLVRGVRTGLGAGVAFLRRNWAANARPSATKNVVPAATKRSLAVSHAASCSAWSAISRGSSRNTVTPAKPMQLRRRQAMVE
jgi:hypothetical protein